MMTAPGRAVMVHTQRCDDKYLCMKIREKWNFVLPKGFIAGSLESAYSLIWGSHKILGKGGGDTLDLL